MAEQALHDINASAHASFLHPNKLPWASVGSDRELSFLARNLHGHNADVKRTQAYLYKELTQLAEIESHVSSTMLRILAEGVASKTDDLWRGSDLVHTLSCFASEEIQHASAFYQYVRVVAGQDLDALDNLYAERLAVYAGTESPAVKLAALTATAYVGESVITVFEARMKALDPAMENSFTYLLHLHGLDEARHVQCDHFVIDTLVPRLTRPEVKQMRDLIAATERLNGQLARNCSVAVKERFGVDYTEGNETAQVQATLTESFRAAVFNGDTVRRVDPYLDAATKRLLLDFTKSDHVHA